MTRRARLSVWAIGLSMALAIASPNAEAQAAARPTPAASKLGESIYEGSLPGFASRVRDARDAQVQLPVQQAACVSCHRPSGLGSFEGNLAVPPIAGGLLFQPFDAATTHRYAWTSKLRVRPAYTEASLAELLRSGRTPDGLNISAVMPRYDLGADEVAALAVHLNTLSGSLAPGVTETGVTFATITTPDVPAAQVAELLGTLNRFVAHKNANTRGETARRGSAQRNEQSMYRRHRTWQLRHWALRGEPQTWGAQLQALYASEPVFAVLSGVGAQTWQPVHAFCAAQRVPCLLPTVALPPQDENFYSVYLSRGLIGQAQAAARHLLNLEPVPLEVLVLAGETPSEHVQARQIAAAFSQALAEAAPANRVRVHQSNTWRADAADHTAIVSALSVAQIAARRQGPGTSTAPAAVFVLSGMAPIGDARASDSVAGLPAAQAWWVTDQLHGPAAQQQLQRANAWLHANGLAGTGVVARNALLAATVAVESLMHADEKFSREYCIEKLEHTLENMPALTAYPRLAIGPRQRFGAKQVMLVPFAPDRIARRD
jgi:cytochrome c553